MRKGVKDESIQKNELFRTFADRITAHQQQVQSPNYLVAETMNNTINNKKFNLNLFLNE